MHFVRSWFVVLGAIVASLMLNAGSADAVDANSKPFQIKLADGRKVTVRLRGNEHLRWLEDKHRLPIVRTPNGYEYAIHDADSDKLAASGHKLGHADPLSLGLAPVSSRASAAKKKRAPIQAPLVKRAKENRALTGTINKLVVLMRFRDHKDRQLPTPQDVEILMNRSGGDPILAPTGSYRDFIHENSYRQLDVLAHVVGWVDLPETEAYYAGHDSGLSGGKLDEALRAALDKIEGQPELGVDFATFDRNQDMAVGAVLFLHSGYAAEDTTGEDADIVRDDRIWSHKSGTKVWTSKSGHIVNNYFVASALFGSDGVEPCRIGVLLHESAHLGALDDHYDNHNGANRSAGIGYWCLTGDHRGFDGTQRYPSHLCAWSKIELGWVKPTEITEPGEYRIRAVERAPEIYKISRGFPEGEYLLIENRQPIGFDQKLPEGTTGRGGLAIWHIDEAKEDNNEPGHPGIVGWPENGRHFKLALLQADGQYDLELPTNRDGNFGDADDLFRRGHVDRLGPGDNGKFPNTDTYQNGVIRRTGIVISEISDSAEEMTFRVAFPPSR